MGFLALTPEGSLRHRHADLALAGRCGPPKPAGIGNNAGVSRRGLEPRTRFSPLSTKSMARISRFEPHQGSWQIPSGGGGMSAAALH